MNIPSYLQVVDTKVIGESKFLEFQCELEKLEHRGTLIVDWFVGDRASRFAYVATVYICEPKGSGL